MPCKVLLLTQWFDPEPTIKGLPFARELVRLGFDVEVLTGFPNYPHGKLYPGYQQRWLQRETIDGVRIRRVPLYPSHDQSALRRVLNYLSFAVTSLLYGLRAAGRADVIYAYHPPLTVGVVAAILKIVRRRPVVYDIQDMWPDTLAATGMISSPRVLGTVAAVCRWVYRAADRIVVLSPGFKQMLEQRGVPSAKLEVIYNWADGVTLRSTQAPLPDDFPGPDRFRVVFAGNLGKAQALDSLLEAARQLQARNSRVSLVFIGGGVEAKPLREKAMAMGLPNVTFLPPGPMPEIGSVLQAADALLVHLRKDRLFEITIPSKTQAYMAVGKPILMAVRGDAADLVKASGAGVVAQPEDPSSIAAAAQSLADMDSERLAQMGARARDYFERYLSLEQGTARFAAIFDRLAGGGAA
jgi:glycosyltransferase involved in cell wall biosynthesis